MMSTPPDAPRPPDADEPAADPWASLRAHTPARIALGRAGTSLPTAEVLRFAAAHAAARDAVHLPLEVAALLAELRAQGHAPVHVQSRAGSRVEYLTRPDLGRQLAPAGRDALEAVRFGGGGCCDCAQHDGTLAAASSAARHAARSRSIHPAPSRSIHPDHDAGVCIVIGDGLSAIAAQHHAAPLMAELAQAGLRPQHVVVATQARVALGDAIGECLGAELVLVLLGERPGLSSPDSLGAYLTWNPHTGRADSERNCVSNIRPAGLPLAAAAARIAWLAREARRRRVTGIALKDDSDVPALAADAAPPLPAT